MVGGAAARACAALGTPISVADTSSVPIHLKRATGLAAVKGKALARRPDGRP
jgi:hypothetical protein